MMGFFSEAPLCYAARKALRRSWALGIRPANHDGQGHFLFFSDREWLFVGLVSFVTSFR
jgi:hypothetical protein